MEMLELLRGLVQIESPTGDTQELCERVIRELEELGFTAARDGEGIRAERPGEGAPLLLLAHLDTVWERGTLARMPWRVEGERAFGPRRLRHEGRDRRPAGGAAAHRVDAGPAGRVHGR